MQTTAREDAPPQFTVSTYLGGAELGDPVKLHDPFVTHTIVIDPKDLENAVRLGLNTIIVVKIDGTRAALAHVFRPIDLSPNDEKPRTIEGAMAEEFPGEVQP